MEGKVISSFIEKCPFCSFEPTLDSYIRDDKRRYRLCCENYNCECFPVKGREYDNLYEAVFRWNER